MNDEEKKSILGYFSEENEDVPIKCPNCSKILKSSELHQMSCSPIPKVYIKCTRCSHVGWVEAESK